MNQNAVLDKKVLYKKSDVREAIFEAASFMLDTVGVTLGAAGKLVAVQRLPHDFTLTKDGVTVAKEVFHENPAVNVICRMILDAADKTARKAGDGTTTTVILASTLIQSLLSNNTLSPDLVKDLKDGSNLVVEALQKIAIPIEGDLDKLRQVASIASNGDERVARLIEQAIDQVGVHGTVTVGESLSGLDEVRVTEGMVFESGIISEHFINDFKKQAAVFENPYFLITNSIIRYPKELIPLLEKVAETKRPIVIMAEGVDGEAATLLAINAAKGTLPNAVISPPGLGSRRQELMKDIAISTGATLVGSDFNIDLENVTLDMLGSAEYFESGAHQTKIVGPKGNAEAIQARIEGIKTLIDQAPSSYEQEKLQDRLAKLSGGVAVIGITAKSDVELKEKRYRVEDAILAATSAVEEGYVEGAGKALMIVKAAVKDINEPAKSILEYVLSRPRQVLYANAGVFDYTTDYNLRGMKKVDLIQDGIVDAHKVVKNAIINAVSVALAVAQIAVIVFFEERKNG